VQQLHHSAGDQWNYRKDRAERLAEEGPSSVSETWVKAVSAKLDMLWNAFRGRSRGPIGMPEDELLMMKSSSGKGLHRG